MKNYKFKFKDKDIEIHSSWEEFFKSLQFYLKIISIEIGDASTFTPDVENIFRIFKKPLNKIQYVILGQDPYPQKDIKTGEKIATGRAFEVSNITNWSELYNNRSLQSILKNIYFLIDKELHDIKFIRKNETKLFPPVELFNNLEENGVFLLNSSLTCLVGSRNESNSHKEKWGYFTKTLIIELNKKRPEIKWLLWGKEAQKAFQNAFNEDLKDLDKIIKFTPPHPASSNLKDFISKSGINELKKYCVKE